MFYLAGLPSILLFIIVIGFTVSVSILGLLIARKYIPHPILMREEVRSATAICTIIGSLFALILALVVVSVWQDYKVQNERIIQEAVTLSILYRDTAGIGSNLKDSLRDKIRAYNDQIINDAWPKMREGKESESTWLAYNKMYSMVIGFKAKSEDEILLKGDLIQSLNKLAEYRRQRLFYATNTDIQQGLWLILITGGVISIVCTYFFKIGSIYTQSMLTILHSGMIGINLFLAISLIYPYRSGIRLKPEPFIKLKEQVFPMVDSGYFISE